MRLPIQVAPVIRETCSGGGRHHAATALTMGGVHPASGACPAGEDCSCGGTCGDVCCKPNNGCHCNGTNSGCICN